jgi:hypothetical protein
MTRRSLGRAAWAVVICGACASAGSCKSGTGGAPPAAPEVGGIQPTLIQYVDADGFDRLVETALKNADPVILIQTETSKPDWGARLNAWIAAWNMGGPAGGKRRTARGQSPLTINGESIRELRLLVDDLMGKAETLAEKGSTWWTEERTRARRVALLKPYSLRFHQGADGTIQLIFFHGAYASQYRDFMAKWADGSDGPEDWSRTVKCSHCKGARTAEGKLVGYRPPAAKASPEDE